MSERVFLGKFFRVEIADVTKDSDGRDHHESAVYSVVKHILEMTGP